MAIDRIGSGSGFTPAQVQHTNGGRQTESTSPIQTGDLSARTSSASGVAPRRNVSPAALQQVSQHMNEAVGLLNAGGAEMLQQGARDGFKSLPPQYQGLALQTARLAGVMSDAVPPGPVLPFSSLAPRLEAVASASSELAAATKLDLAGALAQDAQQRATALGPHVGQLKDAGRITASAIAQMPVAELRANKEVVKEQLTAWAGATETLHKQLREQFGETHPTTVVALEARTEASAAYAKTMLRMVAANLGSMAFNMTVGPLVAGLRRFSGAGN
jgi:hypothetical protein